MPQLYKLKEGEKVLKTVRRHPAVLSFHIKLELALLLFALFFMFPLLRAGWYGRTVFISMAGIALFLMFRTWLFWLSNVFVVTDRRIIDIERKGFFDWVVSEAAFNNIQDISVTTRGILQTLLHAGNLVIQTASGFVNVELHFIKDPAGVKEIINEARGYYTRSAAV